MKALVCEKLGPASDLVYTDMPDPVPGPGEVVIDVKACAINFLDTLIIRGQYQEKPPLPFSPGAEVAGVVSAVGEGVSNVKLGQEVIALGMTGGLAEKAKAPAMACFPKPPGLDFVHAAAFPIAYGTSHLALDHRAKLQKGETLLVLGAAGGVGLTAVEIGKKMGATVIAAASSDEKLAIAKAHGADHLIDYTATDLKTAVKDLGGADVVLDPVGGAAFDAALGAIKWEGRLLVIGFASGDIPEVPVNLTLVKNCSIVGVYWGAYMRKAPQVLMGSMMTLIQWIGAGSLKPEVRHTFPLSQGAEAIQLLADRKAAGKVVVTTE